MEVLFVKIYLCLHAHLYVMLLIFLCWIHSCIHLCSRHFLDTQLSSSVLDTGDLCPQGTYILLVCTFWSVCLSCPTLFHHCLCTRLILSLILCVSAHLIPPSPPVFSFPSLSVLPMLSYSLFHSSSCHNIFSTNVFFSFCVKARGKELSLQSLQA